MFEFIGALPSRYTTGQREFSYVQWDGTLEVGPIYDQNVNESPRAIPPGDPPAYEGQRGWPMSPSWGPGRPVQWGSTPRGPAPRISLDPGV